MRVKDLIQIPPCPKNDNRKRKVTRKVPSWHLTSQESKEFIAKSSKKTEEKQKAADEETKVKHEAVLKHRRLKRNMTKKRLTLATKASKTAHAKSVSLDYLEQARQFKT